jgi:hypothetical protein
VGRDDSTCRTGDDIYAKRKREVRQNFKGHFEKKDLRESLEVADIRSAAKLAMHCETDAIKLSPVKDDERAEKMSFVIAYTVEFGEEGEGNQPYRVLNEAIVKCVPIKMKNVRYFLYGLLEGMRSLPYMQFSKLYRGIDVKVKWEKEDLRIFPSFTSTSRDRGVGERFLKDGRSGTLITLNGLSGYDVCGYSDFWNEKEVILEPFQRVFVCEVNDRGDVLEIEVRDGGESEFLIEGLIKRKYRIGSPESDMIEEALDHWRVVEELEIDGKDEEAEEERRKGMERCERAAENGSRIGMWNAGMGYLLGVGVEQDFERGVKWLKEAGEVKEEDVWMIRELSNREFFSKRVDLSGLLMNKTDDDTTVYYY